MLCFRVGGASPAHLSAQSSRTSPQNPPPSKFHMPPNTPPLPLLAEPTHPKQQSKKKKALTSPPSLSQCPDAQARHDHCSRSHSLARSGAPQYAGCAPRRGCCCAGAAAPGPSSTWAPAGPSCCRRSGGRRCACRRWWRGRWESRPAARPRRPSRSSPTRRRRRARTSW